MAAGVSINDECLKFIKSILPKGSTILEFGSGEGTTWLAKDYKMYSVENQPEWFDKYPNDTTYINCNIHHISSHCIILHYTTLYYIHAYRHVHS